MNLAVLALSSFMLALSGALVPGPLFTLTVSETIKRGFRAGPLIILGHGILELTIVILLVLKVMPFLADGSTRFVMSLGGTVLIVMGLMMVKDAGKAKLRLEEAGKVRGMHPVLTGILGSLSNPYWVIWWITIGLGYLMSALSSGFFGVAAFFAGHISADLLWYSLISFAVSKGRRFLSERGYRFMLYSCGFFLVIFGGWFISSALGAARIGA